MKKLLAAAALSAAVFSSHALANSNLASLTLQAEGEVVTNVALTGSTGFALNLSDLAVLAATEMTTSYDATLFSNNPNATIKTSITEFSNLDVSAALTPAGFTRTFGVGSLNLGGFVVSNPATTLAAATAVSLGVVNISAQDIKLTPVASSLSVLAGTYQATLEVQIIPGSI
jgi:hypothetical protein